MKYERAGLESIMESHTDRRAEAGTNVAEDRGERSRVEPRDTLSDSKEPSSADRVELSGTAAVLNFSSVACQTDLDFSNLQLAEEPPEVLTRSNPFGEGCSANERQPRWSQRTCSREDSGASGRRLREGYREQENDLSRVRVGFADEHTYDRGEVIPPAARRGYADHHPYRVEFDAHEDLRRSQATFEARYDLRQGQPPHSSREPYRERHRREGHHRGSYRGDDWADNDEQIPSNPARAYEIMRKWNVRFGGTRQEDLDAFLLRIEEGRDLVPICDSDMLRVMPFFLTGIALSWFRGSRHLWLTFEEFARACRVRFGDSDFQFELRQEIYKRTQGEKESVSDYLTCMRAIFDRLIPRLPLSEEVSYAHRNILPRLHLNIRRADVVDFVHLELLAIAAEKSYRVVKNYRPPPPPERSLLPELTYREPKLQNSDRRPARHPERIAVMEEPDLYFRNDPVDVVYLSDEQGTTPSRNSPVKDSTSGVRGRPQVGSPKSPPTPNSNPFIPPLIDRRTDMWSPTCWNCSRAGHRHADCREPRKRICYRCGRRDVIKSDCPNCSGNSLERRMRRAMRPLRTRISP